MNAESAVDSHKRSKIIKKQDIHADLILLFSYFYLCLVLVGMDSVAFIISNSSDHAIHSVMSSAQFAVTKTKEPKC